MAQNKSSETHAYAWIKRELKAKGFNTRNPARDAHGEVYTQHVARQNVDLKPALEGGVPENVVQLDARTFWVIEAKSSPKELAKACNEATDYAVAINKNSQTV